MGEWFGFIALLAIVVIVMVTLRKAGGARNNREVPPVAKRRSRAPTARPASAAPEAPPARPLARPAAPLPDPGGVSSAMAVDTVNASATVRLELNSTPQWIPFGTDVRWGSAQIRGGGFYAGVARTQGDRHPALLDPSLPFDYADPDWAGSSMPYWPQYASIQPRARGAYLGFLNSPRHGRVGVGLVFLYFYGLERRLLKDALVDDAARAEVPVILRELERLRSIYRHNPSFESYSSALIGTARAVFLPSQPITEPPDPSPLTLDAACLYAIGRIVADRRPLPAAWALACARAAMPEARSTWDCVWPEARKLFERRYAAAFGTGYVLPVPKSRLKVDYRWAAIAAGRTAAFDLGVPDVSRSQAKFRPLSVLLTGVLNELEPLRRVRRSKNATPLAELAATPKEIATASLPPRLAQFERRISEALATRPHLPMSIQTLVNELGLSTDGKLTKRDASTIATALESMSKGIEPDVRFGAPTPTLAATAVVFELPPDFARVATSAYGAALLLLQAALLVAGDDGWAQAELDAVTRSIEDQFDLSAGERARLAAHIELLRRDPPNIRRIEGVVRTLPAEDRASFAQVLVEIAAADGQITPGEVRLLERFYKALQLDPARVPADLHHAATGGRGAARQRAGSALDDAAIAAKLAETARVQAALSQIFVEESTPDSSAPASAVPGRSPADARVIDGLDVEQTALLEQILGYTADELPRSEFDAWSETLGLPAEGAFEELNELAFARADEALLEDGETLFINPGARETLRTLLAQATPAATP